MKLMEKLFIIHLKIKKEDSMRDKLKEIWKEKYNY